MLNSIIQKYGLPENECTITPFGNGLINTTWLITCHKEQYILQKVNDTVFTYPAKIAENLYYLKQYFAAHFPEYLFVNPIATLTNEEMVSLPGEGHFRMFKFIKGSVTFDTVNNPVIAYEAARQFGKFTRLLSQFNIKHLLDTLPDFHNLHLRYQQFETALLHGNRKRIEACQPAIAYIISQKEIVAIFSKIKQSKHFKKRVTHHDTKISNVLFDKSGTGLCVIDLDTVMPGYFISDVGDMMRTYLSPVSEEENDLSKIEVREEYFQAIVDGYLSEMKNELTEEEKTYFVYAGKFMIYMQAIRFLTDHLNNDIYYGAKYEGHNLVRCNNQLELLKQLIAKEASLQTRITVYMENTVA